MGVASIKCLIIICPPWHQNHVMMVILTIKLCACLSVFLRAKDDLKKETDPFKKKVTTKSSISKKECL